MANQRSLFSFHFLAAALLVSLTALGASGQPSQNDDRGISPGKAYQTGDVDAINLFNGALNLSIPVGQTYHAGGQLAYGFTLHCGNAWDYTSEDYYPNPNTNNPLAVVTNWSYPALSANAGVGWRLSFGSISASGANVISYTAPDGSEHFFQSKLHPNDPNEAVYSVPAGSDPSSVSYTNDGTYLRVRVRSIAGVVRFDLDFPNGNVHQFDANGRFVQMSDPAGNSMSISYGVQASTDPYPGSTVWDVHDSTGRHHYVRFRPGATYSDAASLAVPHEIVGQLDLAAFNGSRAVYQLEYNSGSGTTWTISRRYVRALHPSVGPTVAAYMLTGILLPSSLGRFSMTYSLGDQVTMSYPNSPQPSGNVLSLTTPTNARYAWTYGLYQFPPADPSGVRYLYEHHTSVAGVATRVVTDLSTNKMLSNTAYTPTLTTPNPATEEQVRVDNLDEYGLIVNATRHYFSTCVTQCSNPGEYGLPLTRTSAGIAGGYLSTEFLVPGTTTGTLDVKRSTYVRYEMDALATMISAAISNDKNRRLAYTKTVFEDGSSTETTLSDFDGYGHYRTATMHGVTPAYDETTTGYTNHNSAAGTFGLDSSGNKTGTFVRLFPASPWILGTSSTVRTTNQPASGAATSSESALCFDSRGLLTSRRTYTAFNSSSPQTTDLLSVYSYDAGGNLVREQYAGGDAGVAGVHVHSDAPVPFNCGSTLSADTYSIARDYSSGSLAHAHYTDSNGALSFQNADNTVDANTGLVAASRTGATIASNGTSGTDGIVTTYTYDALGRPLTVSPQIDAGATSQYAYSLTPPSVDVQLLKNTSGQANDLLTRSTTAFDALGRTTLETRYLPSSGQAYRKTAYDLLGRQKSVSELEGTSTPSHLTTFEYDPFGRVTTTTRPDNSKTTTAYTGVSAVSRTTKVATGTDSICAVSR